MKKHLTLIVSAIAVLWSCASFAQTAQKSGQRFQDGIYARPAKTDKAAVAVSDSEIADLSARTRGSQVFFKRGAQGDTLFIPENKVATFRWSPSDSAVTLSLTDPYDYMYRGRYSVGLYPTGYCPYAGFSFGWHSPFFWGPSFSIGWGYPWHHGWYDPWFSCHWGWGGWYDPWCWDPWYWDPWYGSWGWCGPWDMYGPYYYWGGWDYHHHGYYPGHGGRFVDEFRYTPRSSTMGTDTRHIIHSGGSPTHSTAMRNGLGSTSSVRRTSSPSRQSAAPVRSSSAGGTSSTRRASVPSGTAAGSGSVQTERISGSATVRRSSPAVGSARVSSSSASGASSSGSYSRSSSQTRSAGYGNGSSGSYRSSSSNSSVSRSSGGYSGGGYSGGGYSGGGYSGGGASHSSSGGGHRR